MWKLYDDLIDDIPENLLVEDYYQGNWTMLSTKLGAGVSMTVDDESRPNIFKKDIIGSHLKEIAYLSKSWNFKEASLGVAAINSYYNNKERLAKYNLVSDSIRYKEKDAFLTYQDEVKDKKVAVIGHFPFLEERFMPICDLSILERKPLKGDYPDSACEYILCEQDYVFITGITLINKTLPRLLEICKNSKVVMVGPSVPITSKVLNKGVYDISGFVVSSYGDCKESIINHRYRDIFKLGQMVSFKK